MSLLGVGNNAPERFFNLMRRVILSHTIRAPSSALLGQKVTVLLTRAGRTRSVSCVHGVLCTTLQSRFSVY